MLDQQFEANKSVSDKIIRNTIYNTAGTLWFTLIGIFLTPYIVWRIGHERFGIWAIVGVITGYFGLLDFGIGSSFVKYIAEFYAQKEYDKINRLINTGFVSYLIFAVCVITLALFFIDPLLVFFKIPAGLCQEARFVFIVGIILFVSSNALSPFGAIQGGLQRMDISNKISVLISFCNIFGTVYFLEKGYGLRGLMINNAIIFCLSRIIHITIAYRLLPGLRFNPLLLDKTIFKSLFGYGYKLQISRFASLVSFQTDKLLITYFLGLGLVTFYQLGSSLIQQVRQLALLLVSAFIPAVSEIEARKSKEYLREFYLISSKYLIVVSLPLTFFTMLDSSLIMTAWMGKGYEMAALVIRILATGYLAATVSGVASAIAAGVAKTELDMKFGILLATLNLFLSILLVIKMGFVGVVIGTTVSLIAATVYYMRLFHRYMECPVSAFVKLLYKPLGASAVAASATFIFNFIILKTMVSQSRIINVIVILAGSGIFGFIYWHFIMASKYLNTYEKSFLSSKLPFLKHILKS